MIWGTLDARVLSRDVGAIAQAVDCAVRAVTRRPADRYEAAPVDSAKAQREPAPAEMEELRALLGPRPDANTAVVVTKIVTELSVALDAWRGLSPLSSTDKRIAVFFQRGQLVRTATEVERMLDALKGTPLAASFPRAQLDAIKRRAQADIDAMAQPVLAQSFDDALPAKSLTAEQALAALPRLLPGFDGVARLAAARPAIDDQLIAFALLADQAIHAPDYARLPPGVSPQCRAAHRRRQGDAAQSLELRFANYERREHCVATLRSVLGRVARAGDPAAALAAALPNEMLRQCGIAASEATAWRPTTAGILHLLRCEGLTPLRGLWAYRGRMSARNPELRARTLSVLAEMTGAMLAGTYEQWLFEGRIPDEQLRCLDARQRLLWRTADSHAYDGLTTREENGLERMWVTKIGGPSHGFDHGPDCLLPFLANAYTTAILVDDPRHPENAAARCYLRVLEAPGGQPVLYLEPLQRDFPYREHFPDPEDKLRVHAAILRHAVAKADKLGVPLVTADFGVEMAALRTGVPLYEASSYLVMPASRGIREASDTLLRLHDWPQLETRNSDQLPLLVYESRLRAGEGAT